MTRFEPNLVVERLLVHREQHVVYDERFHAGVNVLRGENSSGKSTILNLLFYVLGGDVSDWSEVALLCSTVTAQVRLNGNVATLTRDISEDNRQAMRVFGGPYELAAKSPAGEWLKYPYSRTANLESFSQSLFRLLNLPDVANEVTGNITMHQILRLLYADQLSPVETLFKYESFDSPILRDSIARLLCGTYDNELYSNEIQMRINQRKADALDGELRAMVSVFGSKGDPLTLEWVTQTLQNLVQQRDLVEAEIAKEELAVRQTQNEDQLTLDMQREAYEGVQKLQANLFEVQRELDGVLLNIADSSQFIQTLAKKLEGLQDSAAVSEMLGLVSYGACPACYTPVSEDDGDGSISSCPLCKSSFEGSQLQERVVAMINETGLQLKQSRVLQDARGKRAESLRQKAETLKADWSTAARRLASLQALPSTKHTARLRDLQRAAGYLDRQIEGEHERYKQVEKYDAKAREKLVIDEKIASLSARNELIRLRQSNRLAIAHEEIATEIRTLLRNDLRRQDAFENPDKININFSANTIDVDGIRYFSASSRVILKSSFFLGFLAAAVKDSKFRHPRFCMIDTIEDKGMEPVRSHNFQRQIARISQEALVEHQIIYATAMIASELDVSEYTVGAFSTRDRPTLAIGPGLTQRTIQQGTPRLP